ncbi:alpha/beta hydrolase [Polaromonas sp.]|uniref:alpha/beta hydrolase n=1 Tax=Polaromonas sp. TaxID=1869339 RepID=UPI002CFCA28B|nr:alpha/beta hydrolase [Polaromonas sp.]HQS31790.1 alpha/beta hydrolase [Polaromonas sp.]HQS91513.1 alpha/beta hydrolase [Polaromonas sp.]
MSAVLREDAPAVATPPATGATTASGATAIVFKAAGAWCFGWFHAASGPARGIGVVLCRPMGYEAICAYPTYTTLAEQLAATGFDVLRFDYHGTGDSAGSDTDPDRVAAWIDSTVSATHELQRRSGVSRLALLGVRLGATLAVQAAARLGGVESLVMWAPCVTGRAFARELRAASASRARPASKQDAAGSGDIEALSYTYTAQTLDDLNNLDCQRLDVQPATRVLIIDRDDMPLEGPLPALYSAMGMDTSYRMLPGYAAMMADPHQSALQRETLDQIGAWLSAAPQPQAALLKVRVGEESGAIGPILPAVRETSVAFGPSGSLFGILTEPEQLSPSNPRSNTAILMLNTGCIYRIGPARLYVKMARSWAASGYRAFRFDLNGIGDSPPVAGLEGVSIYARDSTPDVKAAIDYLVVRGCQRVFVMGICSGSYVAFETALADPRVTGQILMNIRLLERQDGYAWQGAMQSYYKSTDFYRRALMRLDMYRRLIRGQVDVAGIARRIRVVLQARFKRTFHQLIHSPAATQGLLAKLKSLSTRGTDTLIIMAAEDDGRDYVDFHFGTLGSYMRGAANFRMVIVEETDHTFSNTAAQQHVIGAVYQHLERQMLKLT